MADMDSLGRISVADTALLVIDIQERFLPHIFEIDRVVENASKLARCCELLKVPVIVTEQNPKALGVTVAQVRRAAEKTAENFEKTAFSVFDDARIAAAINALNRPNILVAGIEAHVCLIKTVLDGIALGYRMHWITDAISSRSASNYDAATRRAIQAGAFSSSAEMAAFQMMKSSDDPAFREISRIVK